MDPLYGVQLFLRFLEVLSIVLQGISLLVIAVTLSGWRREWREKNAAK